MNLSVTTKRYGAFQIKTIKNPDDHRQSLLRGLAKLGEQLSTPALRAAKADSR
jgi:hypothetical protein